MKKRHLIIAFVILCVLLLAACSSSAKADVREEFLFELFTSNKDDRYTKFETAYNAELEKLNSADEEVVNTAMDKITEVIKEYFAVFAPYCTEKAFEKLALRSLPNTLDRMCAQKGVVVVPKAVTFTSNGDSSDKTSEYFDYELTVTLAGEAEEELVLKGSIATEKDTGKISVHEFFNQEDLFAKLR